MNWSAFPYLRVAAVLSLGIFTMDYFAIAYDYDYLFLIVVLSYSVSENIQLPLKYQSLVRSFLLLVSVFLLGCKLYSSKVETINKSIIRSEFRQNVVIKGIIIEELKAKNSFKYLVESEFVETNDSSFYSSANIIITFAQQDSNASKYKSGDKIYFRSKLKLIDKSSNPESFDYKKFLMTKGILQQGFVKESEHYLLQTKKHAKFRQLAENTANFSATTLRKYFTDTTAIGIAEALLIGRKLLISEDITNAYVNTGAIHVLSVSGLHVAIFISVFIWLFNLPNKKGRVWLIIKVFSLLMIVWFYVVLTGMSPSVVRAGSMVSLYIIGKNFFKNTNTYNLLSVAAIAMLIYNPLYLFQTSFQFSFISLLSILYFQPKIKQLWTPPNKPLGFIWDLINVSIAAQILIFPFTIYFFHQFPMYFILSGIVAVPLVTFIIYLGTLLVLMEAVFAVVNQVLSPVLEWLILCLNKAILYISTLPYSVISDIWVSDFMLFLMVWSIIILILWIEKRSNSTFYSFMFLGLFIFSNFSFQNIRANYQNEIVIYDNYSGYLIDIYQGRKLSTIKSINVSDKSEIIITANNRIKHKVTEVVEYDQSLYYIDKGLYYFYTDYEDFVRLKSKLDVKILFVTDTKNNKPEVIFEKIKPEIIILDRNLKPWIRQKWLNLPQDFYRRIHDIKTDGAYSITF